MLLFVQVFEAIATEYELKNPKAKRPTQTASAYTSPNRSRNSSPSPNRRGQYQHSMMNRTKKAVRFNEKFGQTYASDPNIHRSLHTAERPQPIINPTNLAEKSQTGNSSHNGNCSSQNQNDVVPKINVENTDDGTKCGTAGSDCSSSCQSLTLPHKLVARLRQACSLADLQNATAVQCPLSGSLNGLGDNW